MPRLGSALLLGVPLLDLALCGLTAADLASGATAQWSHGLAAVYLGFSLAFGPGLIQWADQRILGTPRESKPSCGPERRGREWRLWRRCLLACLVAWAVLGLFVLLTGDSHRSAALWANGGWFSQLAAISAVWLVLGPGWAQLDDRLKRLRRARRRRRGCWA